MGLDCKSRPTEAEQPLGRDVAVLLPQVLSRFSTLLLRIENPYTQWVRIANPDQRHDSEHPLDRETCSLCLKRQWLSSSAISICRAK